MKRITFTIYGMNGKTTTIPVPSNARGQGPATGGA